MVMSRCEVNKIQEREYRRRLIKNGDEEKCGSKYHYAVHLEGFNHIIR